MPATDRTWMRPAAPDDAGGIADVQVQTWRDAYAGLVPAPVLAAMSVDARAEAWQEILSRTAWPRFGAFVTIGPDGTVDGFAHVAPSRDEDATPSTGELTALYVRSRRWRTGCGTALLAAATDALAAAGFREATLWVLEGNDRARRFYEAREWQADGARKVDRREGASLREVRYRRALPARMPSMLDHLSIQCTDMDASAAFYDAVLAPLGGVRVMEFGNTIGYGVPPVPVLWLGPHETGEGFRECHIALRASDRAAVRAFFEAAVAIGAEVLHEPRVWPEYHPSYYGAFVRDPDGNNVEAVHHKPE